MSVAVPNDGTIVSVKIMSKRTHDVLRVYRSMDRMLAITTLLAFLLDSLLLFITVHLSIDRAGRMTLPFKPTAIFGALCPYIIFG